ncbi:esterase-like activity of phytase family protein [bacterium]|nr:esterase-like activity of phytase family protein [bacterium]MBU1957104.1 esterase-like activity of phytase family protein [bacterium]
MKKLLSLLPIFLLLNGCTLSNSLVYAGNESPKQMEIQILDQTSIAYAPKNGLPFSEISDLSYDVPNHKLYMIGDKGYFYTFDAKFGTKIEELKYLSAFKIDEKNKHGRYDSEGLTQDNKGQLYISFEGTPRISTINKNGYLGNNLKLTKHLQNKKNYRSSNAIFEALTWHPQHGIVTAAEFPMLNKTEKQQSIYALNGTVWNFQAQKHKNSAVTAIEVMDDGNLLILERAYSGLANPFVITLKKLYLDKCDKQRSCQTKVLAEFNSHDGWGVNNYEGLTRIGNNRYLMVSDDGNQQLLRTVLVYFEVKE